MIKRKCNCERELSTQNVVAQQNNIFWKSGSYKKIEAALKK